MASVNDKITDSRNAARPVSTTVSVSRSAGGTNLTCNSLTGWPTASKVHFVTYKIDTNSNPVSGTQLDCYGIVSGSSITSMTVVDGTDSGHAVGDVVEMLPTAAWGQDLSDALNVAHNRDGSLQTVAVNKGGTGNTSLTQSGILYGNGSSALGVTAAGVSGQVLTSNGASAPTWQTNSATGYFQLLKSGSGTHSTNAATNVDTYAISGLTALDTLKIFVSFSAVTQAVAGSVLYSVTDSASVALLYQGSAPVPAGQDYSGEINIRQNRTSSTKYLAQSNDGVSTTASGSTGGSLLNSSLNMSTAWTSPWTIALRLGATTGTAPWAWAIYKIAAQ